MLHLLHLEVYLLFRFRSFYRWIPLIKETPWFFSACSVDDIKLV